MVSTPVTWHNSRIFAWTHTSSFYHHMLASLESPELIFLLAFAFLWVQIFTLPWHALHCTRIRLLARITIRDTVPRRGILRLVVRQPSCLGCVTLIASWIDNCFRFFTWNRNWNTRVSSGLRLCITVYCIVLTDRNALFHTHLFIQKALIRQFIVWTYLVRMTPLCIMCIRLTLLCCSIMHTIRHLFCRQILVWGKAHDCACLRYLVSFCWQLQLFFDYVTTIFPNQ